MKSILFIINYFHPEYASVSQLMTELCVNIQDDFEVSVIAAFPSYTGKENLDHKYKGKRIVNEEYQNVNILRVSVPRFNKKSKISRLKYIISYFFNSLLAIIKSKKFDIVFSVSQPPILGGLLGSFAKKLKGSKFIYNIQDMNPEQAEAVKYFKNSFLFNFARKLDNISCLLADKIIVVGKDMKSKLKKRLSGHSKNIEDKIHVINNWINEKKVYPLNKKHDKVKKFLKQYNMENKFVFMYSGNLGLYYDLENIIKVIEKFKSQREIQFLFVGEGVKKEELMNYCELSRIKNVTFISYQEKEKLVYSLNAADAHFVTNKKGIKGVSVPSKIYGIMAAGKPVVGVLEKGSEAFDLISSSNCGICSEPTDYKSLENSINYFIENKTKVKKLGDNGRKYLEKKLKMKYSIYKYKTIFNSL